MAVYAITQVFCNPSIFDVSIHAFHATRNPDLKLARHVVVDQCYPIDRKGVERTLENLGRYLPVDIMRPGRNLGLHGGFNWAMAQLPLEENDIVIGYDADSLPVNAGWDMALVRAIDGGLSGEFWGQEIVWSTLGNPRTLSDVENRGFDAGCVDGYLRVWLTRSAVTNSVCAWRYGWLKSVGFLQEPRAYYGHLESAMYQKLRSNQRWAILPQFHESDELRNLHDAEYIAYKWFHSHTEEWRGDFKSFLDAGCPGMTKAPSWIP
jgi:hypothetical protein